MMTSGKRNICFVLLCLCALCFIDCSESQPPPIRETKTALPSLIEIRGHTMGTTYMVKIVPKENPKAPDSEELPRSIREGIDSELKLVNHCMSTYIKDSEISRFNRYQESDWFDVSADTSIVFGEALRVSELSGGAFDITVGPLINLWGFGPSKVEQKVPSDNEIETVMAGIGFKKIKVRMSPPALKKENPKLYSSLGAIAKGFGVDKVAEYVESRGYNHYMVEIGGEVRTSGSKFYEQPWRVAIARPDGSSSYQKALPMSDLSMATSGDYHNYFEKDGVRYSHTIDPTTGKPITHNLASVTVIHKSCMTADAVATAINVLGPEKGYNLALNEKLPVLMVLREKGNFIEKMTPEFEKMLGDN